MPPDPDLRSRVVSGAKAQLFNNLVRVAIQVGSIAVLLPVWGLERYGEWLILYSFTAYFTYTDLGYFAAARYDMIMAVGKGDRAHALDVFRAVSRGVGAALAVLAIALPLIAWAVPLTSWFNLENMGEGTAGATVVLLGIDTLLISSSGLLAGGFACAGRYGEGQFWIALIGLVEFAALVALVVATKDPAAAAASMLITRTVGTAAMYLAMRRRAPWLSLGRPIGTPRVLKRLTRPALASAGMPAGVALNVQGMVVIVGVAIGPAASAVFSTVRTLSRIVIQLLSSISSVLAQEFSRAFGEDDRDLLRMLHRRGCRLALWATAPIVLFLAIWGTDLLRIWTSGKVDPSDGLLYLFLAATAVDSLWYASFAVMYSTNRHQRIALIFVVVSILTLPLAWAFLELWELEGAALALLISEVLMLVVVLQQSIPAAFDRLRPWLANVLRPPTPALIKAVIRR